MPNIFFFIFLLLTYAPLCLSSTHLHRRILHQPFFPQDSSPPPTTQQQPSPPPQQQVLPKYPFSSTPTTTPPSNKPFFPLFPTPPPPPPPSSTTSTTTFPANISELIFPQPPHKKPISPKLTAIAVILSLFSAAFFICIILIIYCKRRRTTFNNPKASRSDSHRLFPTTHISNDNHNTNIHKVSRNGVSSNSSEFLYLGTLVNSHGIDSDGGTTGTTGSGTTNARSVAGSGSSPIQKLGSPELHPLPPLSRQNYSREFETVEAGRAATTVAKARTETTSGGSSFRDGDDGDDEEFYSPRGSSGDHKESLGRAGSSERRVLVGAAAASVMIEHLESSRRRSDSSSPSYPTSSSANSPSNSISYSPSLPRSSSSRSSKCSKSKKISKGEVFVVGSLAPPPPPPPPPPPRVPVMGPLPKKRKPISPSPPGSPEKDLGMRVNGVSDQWAQSRINGGLGYSGSAPPSHPPPPPPPRLWETSVGSGQIHQQQEVGSRPPVLVAPSRPVLFQTPVPVVEVSHNLESVERSEETPKLKLKPLHWDKVRASSDRAMVWDQLRSSSFQLNEEMIETLFVVNATSTTPKDNLRHPVLPSPNQENRVLDPKKSQNISILLRALNVTIDEVCEALSEGNTDNLGTELLESLLKMAPTKEEERKLIEYKDDSPSKLGPAERFLKAVVDVPFAFKRVEAMLYIANFDSEVEYLKKSFETLETACEELRNSRMFLKLLEAVLKTGNRMNVGTNRGDAHAFKLDTLLKLADVKGTDGKTTLLHFVVQEIIRAEGSRLAGANQNPMSMKTQQTSFQSDVEFRKLGLQVVSSLSGELTNVRKAAAMDSEVLNNDVSKLARGITNIGEVVRLNESAGLKESTQKFSESMNTFLKKAEEEIIRIQAQESVSLSLVKEITEYFHGNSAREEAHPFRIFLVVRDFLSVLDRVCKEVGKINERTIVSSARQFPVPVNPTQPPIFPIFHAQKQYSSSDDDESSSSS